MVSVSSFISCDIFPSQRKAGSRSQHRRKHAVEIDAEKLQNEFDQNVAPPAGDANLNAVSEAAGSPSDSLQVQNAAHNRQVVREEWAATRIQTAFRGFLVLTSPWHHSSVSDQ